MSAKFKVVSSFYNSKLNKKILSFFIELREELRHQQVELYSKLEELVKSQENVMQTKNSLEQTKRDINASYALLMSEKEKIENSNVDPAENEERKLSIEQEKQELIQKVIL